MTQPQFLAQDGYASNGAPTGPSESQVSSPSSVRPAPLPATIVLSRHGQTEWHAENRYAGSSEIDLTEVGIDQAEALARWAQAHRPDAFYSSPMRRALRTSVPVAAATGIQPVVENDLREVHFGIAEGLTIGELRVRHPDAAALFENDPIGGSFPEAEPPAAAADRGVSVLRKIAAAHPGETVLVIAHNTLIRLVLCALLEIPLANSRRSLPRLDNGTLTHVRLSGEPATPGALLSFNVPLEPFSAPV